MPEENITLPQVTGIVLTCPCQASYQGSGERKQEVNDNASGHYAIKADSTWVELSIILRAIILRAQFSEQFNHNTLTRNRHTIETHRLNLIELKLSRVGIIEPYDNIVAFYKVEAIRMTITEIPNPF